MIINELFDNKPLQQGDPVVIKGAVDLKGATGEIEEISPSGKFAVVNLYNHGRHSFNLANIAYNDYADREEEREFWDTEDGYEDTLGESDIDWTDYERRVQELEDQGVSRSDAQGIVDAEILQSKTEPLDEKQDACYRKVKSRYKVWPSAYASGALVQCRKKGAANWGNKSESVQQSERYAIKHRKSGRILSLQEDIAAIEDEYKKLSSLKEQFVVVRSSNPNVDWRIDENLRKWFKEKWVRFGPDGKIRGDCARGSSKEGKPKCLPQSKAHALGKKGRASAAAKKRREDPNPERRGPARNVATKVKETTTDVKAGMAEIYNRLAPKIERHRDSHLAGQLYDELEAYAEQHGAEKQFNNMMAVARNQAHLEYDTNPGGFHNWFWFLPFENRPLEEKCWDGYRKQGMKKKGDRMVPDCVPANESAIDQLEQRRIDDLNDKMDGVMARISRERIKDPDVIALLMKQYDRYKAERDSYYKIREGKHMTLPKPRDPNYGTLTAKRTSGAGGAHKDKRRQAQQGTAKHPARDLARELDEAAKPKTVAKLAPAIKLFQATIRVKMPDYTGLMDVNVTAPNINMARQMVKAMYNIQNNNVINVKEVKALKEGWSDKYGGVNRPPVPYGVYIDGKQWKEFPTDDHAGAVAEKVRKTIAARGGKQKVTIAPAESWYKSVNEEWSEKYKRSINCNNPKGFSQRAHCQGRKKNEADEGDETDLAPGQYYVWTVYFDDGTHKRIRVTDDDFDPYKYYADRGKTVVNIDFNWDKH